MHSSRASDRTLLAWHHPKPSILRHTKTRNIYSTISSCPTHPSCTCVAPASLVCYLRMFHNKLSITGMVSATCVNPIWFIKTRLQLDRQPNKQRKRVMSVIRDVYHADGWRGFYRVSNSSEIGLITLFNRLQGVTASYVGVTETIIQFVVYEQLRQAGIEMLQECRSQYGAPDDLNLCIVVFICTVFTRNIAVMVRRRIRHCGCVVTTQTSCCSCCVAVRASSSPRH